MFFFRKFPPLPPLKPYKGSLRIETEEGEKQVSIPEFEKLTRATFIPELDFADAKILADLTKRGAKLLKKERLSLEQLWFGSYYQKEILSRYQPDVILRWISPSLGWGVFANRDFKKMEFIAEYAGKVRRWRKADCKNAYCFEYVLAQGIKTPYTIDAQDQGGIARYINHSYKPNLLTALATFQNLSHVVIYAKTPIPKGAQLTYDYGPAYWSHRSSPLLI